MNTFTITNPDTKDFIQFKLSDISFLEHKNVDSNTRTTITLTSDLQIFLSDLGDAAVRDIAIAHMYPEKESIKLFAKYKTFSK